MTLRDVVYWMMFIVMGCAFVYCAILLDRSYRKVGGSPYALSTQLRAVWTKETLIFALILGAVGLMVLGLIALEKMEFFGPPVR